MKKIHKTIISLSIISIIIFSQKSFALCTNELLTKIIIQPEWAEQAKE